MQFEKYKIIHSAKFKRKNS